MTQPNVPEQQTEQATRAKFIAGLHEFADWLAANPWAPTMRDNGYFQHARLQVDLHGENNDATAETIARVRDFADRLGVKADESLDDRTDASVNIGAVEYSVIAWHKGGRPGKPDPRDAELAELRAKVADLESRGLASRDDEDHNRLVRAVEQTMTHQDAGRVANPKLARFLAEKEEKRRVVQSEPVTVHFSFGGDHTDPDTGEGLWRKYVTIVGPSHEACRKAMFASKYGREWGTDYLAGTPRADQWIPRWTEHERIVLADADVEPLTCEQMVPGHEPHDGHRYECCGKVGRISRHNVGCPTLAPAEPGFVADPTGRGRESDPDWVAGFGPVPGSDLVGEH
jgi:hypothetical protein